MKNIENSEWYTSRRLCLEEFMLAERRNILHTTADNRTNYITLLTENMFHPQNASALVRHCEAFGVQTLNTVEEICEFNPNLNIARGTEQWIDIKRHATTTEAIAELKKEGYRIVATTPHTNDCTPETFDISKGKFALVFGTEHAGISPEVMSAADEFLMIPMCGMVESLNVSASAAILIYMLTQRLRHSEIKWQLEPCDREELLYRWMRQSVKDSGRILERCGFTIEE